MYGTPTDKCRWTHPHAPSVDINTSAEVQQMPNAQITQALFETLVPAWPDKRNELTSHFVDGTQFYNAKQQTKSAVVIACHLLGVERVATVHSGPESIFSGQTTITSILAKIFGGYF